MNLKACTLHAAHDLRVGKVDAQPLTAGAVSVAVAYGGICGSDLHYFHDGGFGPIRVREPIVLGHEVSGTVNQVGEDVTDLAVGDKVAISPSQPCNACEYCSAGTFQHCINMRFMGSARTLPHVQGGFRSQMVVAAQQCFKVSASTSLDKAACAEPLAVCLHAANQAGNLKGKRILVTGAGPIGALCCAVARYHGAKEIVVTDLFAFTLDRALEMGATTGLNVSENPGSFEEEITSNGLFDIVFECSAAEPAILSAINGVRPRGTIVQVGVAGNLSLPINSIVGKEIQFIGTHRFHPEFAVAVDLINKGEIDVLPIISHVFSAEDANEAFAIASNRDVAVKVHLKFDETS